jgi:hypothetical protein
MPEAEAALGIEFLERCAVPRQQLGIIHLRDLLRRDEPAELEPDSAGSGEHA